MLPPPPLQLPPPPQQLEDFYHQRVFGCSRGQEVPSKMQPAVTQRCCRMRPHSLHCPYRKPAIELHPCISRALHSYTFVTQTFAICALRPRISRCLCHCMNIFHFSVYKEQCINILHFTNNTTETVCCKAAPSQSIHGTARRRRAPSPHHTCPSTQITQSNNQTIFTHTNTQQKPEKSISKLGPGGRGGNHVN